MAPAADAPGFLVGWAEGIWPDHSRRRIALGLTVAIVLLLAVLPLIPMLRGWYWPATHETLRYAILVDQFSAAFSAGVLYPRWLPDILGG